MRRCIYVCNFRHYDYTKVTAELLLFVPTLGLHTGEKSKSTLSRYVIRYDIVYLRCMQ